MTYATVAIDVNVNMREFTTEDLLDELESRGEYRRGELESRNELMTKIYEKMHIGKNCSEELRKYIWLSIGKMI